MRSALDKLYLISGAISGLCIVLICLVILTRVVGRWFGLVIPSSDDIAGYLLAAASFLALAYSFRAGSHIRVSLFTSHLSSKALLAIERIVLTFASFLTIFLAYHLTYMVWESWDFEEVTSGYIPFPLWAVQSPMAIGAILFCIAIVDLTFDCWFNGTLIPKSEEEELADAGPIDMDVQGEQAK